MTIVRLVKKIPYKLPPYNLVQAQKKVADMFASRDYSLKEIEKKLKPRCSPELLKQILDWVQLQSWFPTSEALQQQVVRVLGRKNKGQNYINKKLKDMGLETVRLEHEIELEKALICIQNKWMPEELLNLKYEQWQKKKAQVLRHLIGRGFDLGVSSAAFNRYFLIKK